MASETEEVSASVAAIKVRRRVDTGIWVFALPNRPAKNVRGREREIEWRDRASAVIVYVVVVVGVGVTEMGWAFRISCGQLRFNWRDAFACGEEIERERARRFDEMSINSP